jgi:RimJ/RimL family protein N-acetyltransferase
MSESGITLTSFSGRLQLVPPDPTLDEIIAIHRTHPQTIKHLRVLPDKMTVEEVRSRREKRATDNTIVDFYAFTLNEDGSRNEFIGVTGIFRIDLDQNNCEIGILVAPSKHGGGYGTEMLYCVIRWVFEERNFHRATFETAVDNIPMQRWLEKAGIRLEAERKEAWRGLRTGEYEDTKAYAILEWEWRDRIKANLETRIRARWDL